MKTILFLIGFLLIISSNKVYAYNRICKDTLITLNKIIVYRYSGIIDNNELLNNNSFNIIIDSCRNAEIKWPGKIIKNNNLTTISYSGKIQEDDWHNLKNYIYETDLLNLIYYREPDAADPTCIEYIIYYNNNKQKKIIDCNHEINILNTLEKNIIKLKDKIEWSINN